MQDLWAFYANPSNNMGSESLVFCELCLLAILISVAIGIILGIAVPSWPL
jgi:ABC-type proline/glycine betaine transport system permease subunit